MRKRTSLTKTMPPKTNKKHSHYSAVLSAHRARLERLIERRGVSQVQKVYDEAASELGARLKSLTARRQSQTYDAHMNRLVLAQIKTGQHTMNQRILGEMSDIDSEAQVETIQSLSRDLEHLWKKYRGETLEIPIDEAVSLHSLVGKRQNQLDKMHADSLARWGARTFNKIHKSLSMSVATMDTPDQAMRRIMDPKTGNPDLEFWQAERIVRTEGSWATNRTHADGIEEASRVVPELMLRWVEHVSEDGRPLDDRVGEDSLVLHGQIVEPGGLFVMPEDPDVSEDMWGEMWMHPPNRPNDRSIVSAWFPGMGVMAWVYRGGIRIDVE